MGASPVKATAARADLELVKAHAAGLSHGPNPRILQLDKVSGFMRLAAINFVLAQIGPLALAR